MIWIYYDFYKYSSIPDHTVQAFDAYLKKQDYFFVLATLLTKDSDQNNSRNAGSLEYVDDFSDKWKYFEVGDEVTIVGDDSAKQYTIMAIYKVNHTYAEQDEYNYPGYEVIFYLPAFEYLNYAKSTEKGEIQPMRYLFNTTGSQNIDDELQEGEI